jgi:hypothetical protein
MLGKCYLVGSKLQKYPFAGCNTKICNSQHNNMQLVMPHTQQQTILIIILQHRTCSSDIETVSWDIPNLSPEDFNAANVVTCSMAHVVLGVKTSAQNLDTRLDCPKGGDAFVWTQNVVHQELMINVEHLFS